MKSVNRTHFSRLLCGKESISHIEVEVIIEGVIVASAAIRGSYRANVINRRGRQGQPHVNGKGNIHREGRGV